MIRKDGEISARLVPINPVAPWPFSTLQRIKYVRTLITQACYWPLLFRELRRADIVHVALAAFIGILYVKDVFRRIARGTP